jgi:hypothetical protein
MKAFLLWLNYLVAPPFRLLGHVFFRLMGHSRLCVGTLTFWGPRDFLESCTESVRRIQELDPELFNRLTTKQKLEFYYSPKHLEQAYFVWLFSIDDTYTAWHSDGIIARLVYSAQLATLIPRRVVTKAMCHALHSEALATTRLWLETRHFPEPLVDAFRVQAA